MITMSLSDMAHILHAALPKKDTVFHGVSTDTRTLTAGNLFIAIKGEHFDGHEFLAEALKKGAAAALVSEPCNADLPQIIVDDTIEAMGKLSAHWRSSFQLPLVAVTGSNGKTTLKNMLASIFRAACNNDTNRVLATKGNLNNAIGLPLSLFQLSEQHQFGVIEMGMNHFGEIAYLTQLTKPTIAVITNAAECHLEGVGSSIQGVAQAKGEIFEGLSSSGIAILNRDDAFYSYWLKLVGDRKSLSFGLKQPADITATIIDNTITLKTPSGQIDVTLPLLGIHNIMNALAATAAAIALKIDLHAIKQGLENVSPAPGRMNQHMLPGNRCIIDDTYNANPFSLDAAVTTLATFKGTKIVVLGDMKELGEDAKQIHFRSGEKIRDSKIDYLFTFGELSAAASEAFGKHAMHFTDKESLIQALLPYIKNQTTILVKGSRSMKMESIIDALKMKINTTQPTH